MRTTTRLTYGSSPHQFGEFRRAGGSGSVALVVHFHGGFWRSRYGLDHARPFCAGLRRAGLATLNVEYRRIGQEGGGWPGTCTDARDALGLVPRLVDEHDVDPARVVVTGHSAGGHLALWAAGNTDVALAGVVPFGAIYDLHAAHARRLSDGGTAPVELLGAEPDEEPERWRAASPILAVPLPMEVVAVHGRRDGQVPIAQARSYVDAAVAAGGRARLVEVDEGHFEVLDHASDTFAAVLAAIDNLVAGQRGAA